MIAKRSSEPHPGCLNALWFCFPQILIATSTLAWGVNFPAHLVVVKGTEYYDGKTRRYVDFPITDVLQMMGRAGRPQYDEHGVAVILVHDIKKHFYKKFLYEPFPVESRWLFLVLTVNYRLLLSRDIFGVLPSMTFHHVATRWLHYDHADFVALLWTDLAKACVYIALATSSKIFWSNLHPVYT